jgi:hypothetical protein
MHEDDNIDPGKIKAISQRLNPVTPPDKLAKHPLFVETSILAAQTVSRAVSRATAALPQHCPPSTSLTVDGNLPIMPA